MWSDQAGSGPDEHPDRLRWNAKYGGEFVPSFSPHPLAVRALSMDLPDGPVAELAFGPSGGALLAAEVFAAAVRAVAAGGLVAWEAFTAEARQSRPTLRPEWCLAAGEPASLLPPDFTLLDDHASGLKRQLLARRHS